jgi:hypothetical protein
LKVIFSQNSPFLWHVILHFCAAVVWS